MRSSESIWAVNRFVCLGSTASVKAALSSEQIDATAIHTYVAQQIVEEKKGHIIGDAAEVVPWQFVGITASQAMLQDHRPLVARFLNALNQSVRYYLNLFEKEPRCPVASCSPEKIKAATLIAHYIKPTLTLDQVIQFPFYIDPKGTLDVDSVREQIHWYQKHKMVSSGISLDKVVDSGFIQ